MFKLIVSKTPAFKLLKLLYVTFIRLFFSNMNLLHNNGDEQNLQLGKDNIPSLLY